MVDVPLAVTCTLSNKASGEHFTSCFACNAHRWWFNEVFFFTFRHSSSRRRWKANYGVESASEEVEIIQVYFWFANDRVGSNIGGIIFCARFFREISSRRGHPI